MRSRCGALLAGLPAAQIARGKQQLRDFLGRTGFRGPVIDYRKWTGQFGSASAVATALAVHFIRQGSVPASLCGGTAENLNGRSVLVLGLGSFVTAVEIGAP
jgi:3-oxoacyl-[acyl-carrier-protein] synthase-1/3-oxoacyl-[acyl-carrier-protein] synthase II